MDGLERTPSSRGVVLVPGSTVDGRGPAPCPWLQRSIAACQLVGELSAKHKRRSPKLLALGRLVLAGGGCGQEALSIVPARLVNGCFRGQAQDTSRCHARKWPRGLGVRITRSVSRGCYTGRDGMVLVWGNTGSALQQVSKVNKFGALQMHAFRGKCIRVWDKRGLACLPVICSEKR